MNFRQIEAFRAVMVAGTVTAAGNILCVTQPAVTRLISNLEREVGFKLFERRRNRLVPTAEGKSFYVEVERSFIGLKQIVSAADAIRNMEKGRLNVVATPMMAYGILPRIIGIFKADYPDVYIELLLGPRELVIEKISSQLFDIAIETPPIKDPAVTEHPLTSESAVCVLPIDHPLSERQEILATDLEGESFVSLPLDSMFRNQTDEIFRNENVTRRISVETHTQQSVCHMVASGVGVSVVGPYVIDDVKGLPLVFRPFQPSITIEYALLYPTLRPTSAITEKFTEYVRQYFDRRFFADS